jgi:hypothetical protein
LKPSSTIQYIKWTSKESYGLLTSTESSFSGLIVILNLWKSAEGSKPILRFVFIELSELLYDWHHVTIAGLSPKKIKYNNNNSHKI